MDAALTLVLGGAGSGKSRHAEALMLDAPAPWIYLATGQARDAEMGAKIAVHRARRGDEWHTVEVPLALADALDEAGERPVLVDCLTLWLSNLLLGGHDIEQAAAAALAALARHGLSATATAHDPASGTLPVVPAAC